MDPLLRVKVFPVKPSYGSGDIGQRHALFLLAFTGCLIMYASRVILSISMVAMTAPIVRNYSVSSNGSQEDTCPDPGVVASVTMTSAVLNESVVQKKPTVTKLQQRFDWDAEMQGILHGAFFYGYIISQVPGGWVAHQYGAKLPFAVCMLANGILTLLSPMAASAGAWVFFLARFLLGICQGVIYPTVAALWSQWAPPLERGRLLSGSYSGFQVGTVVGMYIAGLLAQNFGWESIFYCFGALCLLWVLIWLLLAYNTPSQHPKISVAEHDYITNALSPGKPFEDTQTGTSRKNTPRRRVPWLSIITTIPVIALLIVEVCHNFAFFSIITNMPTYLSNVHHFSLKSNGLLSAMPYLVRWFITLASVTMADWILTRQFCSATVLRKVMSVSAFIGCGLCLLGVAFAGCNSTLVVVLFTVGVGLSGCLFAGYLVAYTEMTPNYASILMGLGNTAGTISGIVAPYVIGVLTNGVNGDSVGSWRTVFLISAGLYTVASVLYAVFATAKRQVWD